MASTEDLTWLVAQRSRNQDLLLELCLFGRSQADQLLVDDRARTVFHLLVGAAFSLWRAVFLAERNTDTKVLLDQSQLFLETLVADNAIGYYQDKKLQAWSAGYYLNNAYYRVQEVIELLRDEGALGGAQLPEFARFEEQVQRSMVSTDRRSAWEAAHDAASGVLTILRERGGPISKSSDV
jgi:hypothetical protein